MSPGEPRILAEVGGLVIAEDGPLVLVVDRGTGPPAVLAFVAAVVALVFGGFGAVSVAQVPAWFCASLLAVGLAAAAVAVVTIRRISRRRSIPVSSYRPVAVFDRANMVYLDGRGEVVAPLDAVTFDRRTQLGSSSPKLVVQTPSGTRVLLRGNPFTGGLGDLDAVLASAVRGPAR